MSSNKAFSAFNAAKEKLWFSRFRHPTMEQSVIALCEHIKNGPELTDEDKREIGLLIEDEFRDLAGVDLTRIKVIHEMLDVLKRKGPRLFNMGIKDNTDKWLRFVEYLESKMLPFDKLTEDQKHILAKILVENHKKGKPLVIADIVNNLNYNREAFNDYQSIDIIEINRDFMAFIIRESQVRTFFVEDFRALRARVEEEVDIAMSEQLINQPIKKLRTEKYEEPAFSKHLFRLGTFEPGDFEYYVRRKDPSAHLRSLGAKLDFKAMLEEHKLLSEENAHMRLGTGMVSPTPITPSFLQAFLDKFKEKHASFTSIVREVSFIKIKK